MEKLPILTVYENRLRTLSLKLWSKLGFALILIFVISFAIRVFRLDFYSLWYDEVSTAYLVQPDAGQSPLSRIIDTTGSETLHPLYYLLLGQWTKIAGNSVWALRLPSVLFGSCTVVVYGLLLYRIGGRKGFAFDLLLVVSPFLIWYSRDARPYALIMLLSGLHLLFYLGPVNETRGRMYLLGFIITGILSIYSGIFIGMLLTAELAWGLLRRRPREVVAVVLVLVFALPLFWQGYRTFFQGSSERRRDLPKGMSPVRIAGFPQEFLVGRSLGPTANEVRRFPLGNVISQKSLEIGVEIAAVTCVLASFAACVWSWRRSSTSGEYDVRAIYALGFITLVVCFQAATLIAITGYQMNARHIAFLFGPLFVLGIYPISRSNENLTKILFVAPLLVLWIWSSANQIFNPAYVPEDFKNAALVIERDEHNASQVVALCHPNALPYYGVKKNLVYFMESPDVKVETLKDCLQNGSNPVWLVLNRPWAYPNFHAKDLRRYFQILQVKQLPGINMWLLLPSNNLN